MTLVPPGGGVLPVDKPSGPTSHDVVAGLRRVLRGEKVGHTGTLDPFASGLLLLCVGGATRLAEYLKDLPKEYEAQVRLGVRTDTDDREGAVTAKSEAWKELRREQIEEGLSGLVGTHPQVPPSYSAKKVDGQPAHRKVRRGESVDLAPVEVTVHEMDILQMKLPDLYVRVVCGAGTYVRALARDLGEALGVGAHLTELRRVGVGPFRVDQAVGASELEDGRRLRSAWITPLEALAHLPRVEVDEGAARDLGHGRTVPIPVDAPPAADAPLALSCEEELVAVARREGRHLRPMKVFRR